MPTLRLVVDPDRLTEPETMAALAQAAAILRGGGTVALPTETVYGLGANALDIGAVAKIFKAKERPGWDPLIVHVADEAMLRDVVSEVPEAARRLMTAFWPGPLTLLLPRSARVPDAVTSGRPLVGVRMPAHPVALELIRLARVPIAAPSANRFGHTSPTTAAHVLEDLDGRIDAVVDAGESQVGVESTVLGPSRDGETAPMIVYRPGAITLDQIRAIAGKAELFSEQDLPGAELRGATEPVELMETMQSMPSPGVGLRHYAPKARLVLVGGDGRDAIGWADATGKIVVQFAGERVGVMWPVDWTRVALGSGVAAVFDWGVWSQPESLAHRLFAGLRDLDARGCTVIVCPVPPEKGIGTAIRDRLRKAAWRG